MNTKNNIASQYIQHAKSWDSTDEWDEQAKFLIPKDIQQNIVDNLGFIKPSVIQGVSIPLIASEPYHSLIAQAKNGSGKTGSFAIASTLRVDR